jgi:hypothetical protein
VAVETWQTLLVYVHTEATQRVERGTALTFVPRFEGVTFTPDRRNGAFRSPAHASDLHCAPATPPPRRRRP